MSTSRVAVVKTSPGTDLLLSGTVTYLGRGLLGSVDLTPKRAVGKDLT